MLYFLKKSRKTPGIIIILPLSNQNLDDMIYSSWDIECEGLKLVILGYFSPFILPENPKNQNFEKMKKSNGDIIILHVCTKNHNHMMFDSWDREWDGWNFLWFWAIFCPFTPSNNSENQNFEKIKKGPRDAIILHMCTKNHNHMMYASWDTECNRKNFLIAILAYYLPFYPINNPGTQILKKWKK